MIRGCNMSWLWTILLLTLAFSNLSEANNHEKKLRPAVVVGTVYCDTCFQQEFSEASHFISGASVEVECRDTGSGPTFKEEVKTNEHGEFTVHLPFSVGKHVRKIKRCSVKLVKSSEPYCAVASTATSSLLHLKSRKEGMHIYSAGFLTFKPLKQPELCAQKPSFPHTKKSLISNPNDPTFLPPIQDPPSNAIGQNLPPLPQLPNLPPLPQLPPLPAIPGMPFFPPGPSKQESSISKDTTKESAELNKQAIDQSNFFTPILPLPPNPFQPPSIFPPNPLQPPPSVIPPIIPSPPPSIFPPIFPSPPPSIFPPIFPTPSPPFFKFPPIPGLTPSPPPPPPTFPIPLPPFPFQPTPGFPGVPPADVSSSSTTKAP